MFYRTRARSSIYFWVFIMSVMLSPFSRIRPSGFLVSFLVFISSASSRTRFMYSSKPYNIKSEKMEWIDAKQVLQLCALQCAGLFARIALSEYEISEKYK